MCTAADPTSQSCTMCLAQLGNLLSNIRWQQEYHGQHWAVRVGRILVDTAVAPAALNQTHPSPALPTTLQARRTPGWERWC